MLAAVCEYATSVPRHSRSAVSSAAGVWQALRGCLMSGLCNVVMDDVMCPCVNSAYGRVKGFRVQR